MRSGSLTRGGIGAALMSSLNRDSISSRNRQIPRVIISLGPLYLLLQIRNLLVDRIILNFYKPLAKIKRVVIRIMSTFSAALINHITHISAVKSAVKVVA